MKLTTNIFDSIKKNIKLQYIISLAFLLLCILLSLKRFYRPEVLCFLAVVACLCFYLLQNEIGTVKNVIWLIYFVLFSIPLYHFITKIIYITSIPGDWDFPAFYLFGKVAAEGYNFYVPENCHIIFDSLNYQFLTVDEFVKTEVDVGFQYPPQSMLYFAPLGFLSFHTALISWTVFNLLFMLGSIYLTYNIFLKKHKLNGVLLVAILFLLSVMVQFTISCAQTNFILLFLLLLMYKYSDHKMAGVYLSIAVVTKPYMIIFVLFFILTKKWNAIKYFIISSLAIVGLTIICFGTAPFISFLFDNPGYKLPKEELAEDINQSLLAVLFRFNIISSSKPVIYLVILSGILGITVLFVHFLIRRRLYDYAWVVLLLTGVMIYPGTLSHYGVLLFFVIFHFFHKKSNLWLSSYYLIPIIVIFYYLNAYSVFMAIFFLLAVTTSKWLFMNAKKTNLSP